MNGGMSAIGTKRTSPSALHMSAFDPKRKSVGHSTACFCTPTGAFPSADFSRYDALS
jgi:hypothetical protein